MLRNYVAETSSAPGTSSIINLAGAVAGRVTFGTFFANNAVCFYYMTDGTISEWGIGLYNTGSPAQLTRTTVLGNSSAGTSRLNFTGTTTVYNAVPAERTIYADANNLVTTPGPMQVNGTLSVQGTFTVAGGGASIVGGLGVAGGLTLSTGTFVMGSNQLLTARQTGWVAPTGTVSRATFDQSTVTLAQLAQRVAALVNDLTTHGLIGA